MRSRFAGGLRGTHRLHLGVARVQSLECAAADDGAAVHDPHERDVGCAQRVEIESVLALRGRDGPHLLDMLVDEEPGGLRARKVVHRDLHSLRIPKPSPTPAERGCSGPRPDHGMVSRVTEPPDARTVLDLDGVPVLVTGGTSGLGFAMSQALAQAGARVALTGRTEARAQDAAARIAAGTRVTGLAMDVRDEQSVSAGVEQAISALGGLDVLLTTRASACAPSTRVS